MNQRIFRLCSSICFILFLIIAFFCTTRFPPTARASRAVLFPQACAPAEHSGTITANETWCAADNPHLLTDEVIVAAGVTLTLEPGVIVQGGIYDGLHILGRMVAIGEADQPITFSSKQDTGGGQWRGLGFKGSAASGELRHVIIRYGGMYHSDVGSFAELALLDVGAGGVTLEDSQVLSANYSSSDHTYGIQVSNSRFTMRRTTVSGMGCCSGDSAVSISGPNTVATLEDNLLTGNPGTTLIASSAASAAIRGNELFGNWLAMSVSGDGVLVENNYIHDNGSSVTTSGALSASGNAIVRGNLIANNNSSYGAVGIGGSPQLINNVIVGNHTVYNCSAIDIGAGATPIFYHNTIANNQGGSGAAICLNGEGPRGEFHNTIIANQDIGVMTYWDTVSVTMDHTLWDNVPLREDGPGSLVNIFPVYGAAAFDLDGYHLTRQSAAIGKGASSTVTADIDGEARPLPVGTLPDLGADEFTGDQAPTFWIEFYTDDPRLEALPAGGVRVQQDFYFFWNYGSAEDDPPDLPISIVNTLDEGMDFETMEISGSKSFSFTQNGQTLTWTSQQDAVKGDYGFIRCRISYSAEVQAGDAVDNTVHVTAGATTFDQTLTTQIPHFPPKITWPIDGEQCSSQFINMVVSGYAMPGSLIYLYEDGTQRATGAANDEDGLFIITYASEEAGIDDYTQITVKSCNPASIFDCSSPSNPVTITRQSSFWCPSRSWWEGDFQTIHGGEENYHTKFGFRDNDGKLATENWLFFAGTGLQNSTLSLHLCICPGGIDYPSQTWVMVSGKRYNPSGGTTNIPTFSIPAASGAVEFHGVCGASELVNHGTILVDPDGFIFDVTQGFDEADPAKQFVLPGATVTLMVSEPELGGWVQWPAALYNHQVNPQVTGADGYYAFYTPPGSYYVQVSGLGGFQPWRSPVITVTSQLVHMNVPLTPLTSLKLTPVNLSVNGPDHPIVWIQPGDTVEWRAEVEPNLSTAARQEYTQNPVLHVLSLNDPLTNLLGWDSGMLAPGLVYRRIFPQAGRFSYQDGLGHSADVYVGGLRTYLPLLRK